MFLFWFQSQAGTTTRGCSSWSPLSSSSSSASSLYSSPSKSVRDVCVSTTLRWTHVWYNTGLQEANRNDTQRWIQGKSICPKKVPIQKLHVFVCGDITSSGSVKEDPRCQPRPKCLHLGRIKVAKLCFTPPLTLVDLGRGCKGCADLRPKFLHFHTFFGTDWSNSSSAPLRRWRFPLGRHCLNQASLLVPFQSH